MQNILTRNITSFKRRVSNFQMMQRLRLSRKNDPTTDHRFNADTHATFKRLRANPIVADFSAIPFGPNVSFTIHLRNGEIINAVVLARIQSILGANAKFQRSSQEMGMVMFNRPIS